LYGKRVRTETQGILVRVSLDWEQEEANAGSAGNFLLRAPVAKVLAVLPEAFDAGYGDKVNLETEPDLDAIRSQVEFKTLVSRLPGP
jgi:hypothetical protein